MNLNQFCQQSHIPAKLTRSVVNQLAGWEEFKNSAPDIARYGIDGGFHGFIYYVDTVRFFKKNRYDIMKLAETEADSLGEDVLTMIASFNCMKSLDVTTSEIAKAIYSGKGECVDQIMNCLAWFAGEEVCRAWEDLNE